MRSSSAPAGDWILVIGPEAILSSGLRGPQGHRSTSVFASPPGLAGLAGLAQAKLGYFRRLPVVLEPAST